MFKYITCDQLNQLIDKNWDVTKGDVNNNKLRCLLLLFLYNYYLTVIYNYTIRIYGLYVEYIYDDTYTTLDLSKTKKITLFLNMLYRYHKENPSFDWGLDLMKIATITGELMVLNSSGIKTTILFDETDLFDKYKWLYNISIGDIYDLFLKVNTGKNKIIKLLLENKNINFENQRRYLTDIIYIYELNSYYDLDY